MKQKEFDLWKAEVDLANLEHLKALRKKLYRWATRDGRKRELYDYLKNRIWRLEMVEMRAVISNAPLKEQTILMNRRDFQDIMDWGKGISMGCKVPTTSTSSPSTKKDSEPGSTR